jgi:hypothetical protein
MKRVPWGYEDRQIVHDKLIVTTEVTYLECPFGHMDCQFGTEHEERAFCRGIPDMEVCPHWRFGVWVDGCLKIYKTRTAAKRMATVYRKMGKKVDCTIS